MSGAVIGVQMKQGGNVRGGGALGRRWAALVASAVLVATGAATASAATTITFWHDWGGSGGQVIESIVQQFNKSQSDVQVKIVLTSNQGQKLMAAVAGGASPDVVLLDRFTTSQFAANGALRALDDLIAADGLSPATFFGPTWQEANWQGKQYGIPTNTDSRVLLYLKSTLEQVGIDASRPPDTWEALRSASLKMTQKQGGKLSKVGFIPDWGNISLKEYIWQNGGSLLSPDMTKVTFAETAAQEALRFVVDFVDQYGGQEAIDEFGQRVDWAAGPLGPMLRGQVGLIFEGSWTLGDVLKNFPALYNKELAAGLPPAKVRRATLSGGHGLVIPAGAAHPQAAWKFIRYFTSQEAQIRFALGTGIIPANREAAVSPQLIQDPVRRVFIQAMEYTFVRPNHPAYPQIDALISDAWWKAIRHQMSPQSALEESARQAQLILDRYNQHYRK